MEKPEKILRNFEHIPYENISKIYRLTLADSFRPRERDILIEDAAKNHWGGTCFSLTNALIQNLRDENIDAWPVSAQMERNTFPHFAVVYRWRNVLHFTDPGYMIHNGIKLNKDIMTYSNSVMNYEFIKNDKFAYKVYSTHLNNKQFRYEFLPDRIADSVFLDYWQKSFKYIQTLTAARIVNKQFIYISGDYVQIRTAGSVEKYKGLPKVRIFLKKYFHFSKEEIDLALEILEKYHS